jgi:hypothetical protein
MSWRERRFGFGGRGGLGTPNSNKGKGNNNSGGGGGKGRGRSRGGGNGLGPSSVATVLFDSTLNTLSEVEITGINVYDELYIDLDLGAHGGTNTQFLLSTDGGSTYLTTSGDYKLTRILDTATLNELSIASGFISGGATDANCFFSMRGMGSATERTAAIGMYGAAGSFPGRVVRITGDVAAIHDAIKFLPSAGSWTGGRLLVRGVTYVNKTVLADTDLNTLSEVVVTGIDNYDWIQVDLNLAASAGVVAGELSTDGGSTWLNGASDMRRNYLFDTSSGVNIAADAADAAPAGQSSISLRWDIRNMDNADMRTSLTGLRGYGSVALEEMWLSDVAAVHDAFRIVARSSTFTAGHVTISGIKQ